MSNFILDYKFLDISQKFRDRWKISQILILQFFLLRLPILEWLVPYNANKFDVRCVWCLQSTEKYLKKVKTFQNLVEIGRRWYSTSVTSEKNSVEFQKHSTAPHKMKYTSLVVGPNSLTFSSIRNVSFFSQMLRWTRISYFCFLPILAPKNSVQRKSKIFSLM